MKSTLVVDQLTVLSDAIRVRMLAVLEGRELTVSELCDIVQLPQSTVSRHLKTLADGEWVTSRRDGTRRRRVGRTPGWHYRPRALRVR